MTIELRLIEPVKRFNNSYNYPTGTLTKNDLFGETKFIPYVDIYYKEDRYVISAELPGINKNDIKINLEDKILTISGEKLPGYSKKHNNKFIRLERSFGVFERRFRVPAHVEADKIVANYKDGILEIALPKKEESKPEKLDIQIN